MLAGVPEVRSTVYRCACVLGALRVYNARHGKALKFTSLTPSHFIDKATLEVDRDELVRRIAADSKLHAADAAELGAAIDSELTAAPFPQALVNGHDLMGVLALSLRHRFGSNPASDVDVERLNRSLRLAYEAESFQQSAVRARLAEWEAHNRTRILR